MLAIFRKIYFNYSILFLIFSLPSSGIIVDDKKGQEDVKKGKVHGFKITKKEVVFFA